MRLFPAQYDGTCSDGRDCDGEFEAGDMIGYDEDDEPCCRACLMKQRWDTHESAKGWWPE